MTEVSVSVTLTMFIISSILTSQLWSIQRLGLQLTCTSGIAAEKVSATEDLKWLFITIDSKSPVTCTFWRISSYGPKQPIGSGEQRILTNDRENNLRRVPGFAKTTIAYQQRGENLLGRKRALL
jgi:hypothetical protein